MFKTIKKSKKTKARTGVLSTEHGKIKTPIFMPPATRGYLKSLDSIDINSTNSQIVLVNTYHMLLKPGDKYIKKYGGIHSFMNYTNPILSDSGGFQIFSLKKMVKITEDGALFKSPVDGTEYFITPEKSIQIQHNLGVDIVMAFDECMPDSYTKKEAIDSVNRTYR
jgi:queuine tRNA-ribosyltransferase